MIERDKQPNEVVPSYSLQSHIILTVVALVIAIGVISLQIFYKISGIFQSYVSSAYCNAYLTLKYGVNLKLFYQNMFFTSLSACICLIICLILVFFANNNQKKQRQKSIIKICFFQGWSITFQMAVFVSCLCLIFQLGKCLQVYYLKWIIILLASLILLIISLILFYKYITLLQEIEKKNKKNKKNSQVNRIIDDQVRDMVSAYASIVKDNSVREPLIDQYYYEDNRLNNKNNMNIQQNQNSAYNNYMKQFQKNKQKQLKIQDQYMNNKQVNNNYIKSPLNKNNKQVDPLMYLQPKSALVQQQYFFNKTQNINKSVQLQQSPKKQKIKFKKLKKKEKKNENITKIQTEMKIQQQIQKANTPVASSQPSTFKKQQLRPKRMPAPLPLYLYRDHPDPEQNFFKNIVCLFEKVQQFNKKQKDRKQAKIDKLKHRQQREQRRKQKQIKKKQKQQLKKKLMQQDGWSHDSQFQSSSEESSQTDGEPVSQISQSQQQVNHQAQLCYFKPRILPNPKPKKQKILFEQKHPDEINSQIEQSQSTNKIKAKQKMLQKSKLKQQNTEVKNKIKTKQQTILEVLKEKYNHFPQRQQEHQNYNQTL